MYQTLWPRWLARTLRQLALTSTFILATGAAQAQWAVIDEGNIQQTIQVVNNGVKQLQQLQQVYGQVQGIQNAIGAAGPLAGVQSAFNLGGTVNTMASGMFDTSSFSSWISSGTSVGGQLSSLAGSATSLANGGSSGGISGALSTVSGARSIMQGAFDVWQKNTKTGQTDNPTATHSYNDVASARAHRQQEAHDAAIDGEAMAAATPASVQASVTQASTLGTQARAATTEREQLIAIADGEAAIVASLGKIEMQLAAINRSLASNNLVNTPIIYGQASPTGQASSTTGATP